MAADPDNDDDLALQREMDALLYDTELNHGMEMDDGMPPRHPNGTNDHSALQDRFSETDKRDKQREKDHERQRRHARRKKREAARRRRDHDVDTENSEQGRTLGVDS